MVIYFYEFNYYHANKQIYTAKLQHAKNFCSLEENFIKSVFDDLAIFIFTVPSNRWVRIRKIAFNYYMYYKL